MVLSISREEEDADSQYFLGPQSTSSITLRRPRHTDTTESELEMETVQGCEWGLAARKKGKGDAV